MIPVQIVQFDLDGKFIKLFDCIADAIKETGISRSSIAACTNKRSKSAAFYC